MIQKRRVPSEAGRPQSERFIEAARELECDESEERFEAALRAIAKAKTKPKGEPEREPKQPPASDER